MAPKTMTHDGRISLRIDSDLKQKGETILAELGIKPSQAINMFYAQIVAQRGFPLELKIPNDETIAAMNEDLSNAPRFTSVEDLMTDLHYDDNSE